MKQAILSATRYCTQVGFSLIPESRCFRLKAMLLRVIGRDVNRSARVCSSSTIVGVGMLKVGQDTWIGHEVMIVCSADVTIGCNVDIGPRAYIGTGSHLIDPQGERVAGSGASSPIAIHDGAWVGACATILPGVRIGRMAVIGAGAVVTQDVAPGDVVVGVPARRLRNIWEFVDVDL